MTKTRASGFWHILTPSGFMVAGMRDRSEGKLTAKYARVMGSAWVMLAANGYRTLFIERRPASSEPRNG